ncbi:MAG: hypothetical protein LBU56_03595 [Rickettsiales bacterium]|jgi:hypothetical protein|nr:hypothetical protein [Rickettsiales bacterium]
MNKVILFVSVAVLLVFQACSQKTEYVPCESGHGYLYKNGKEFICPFTILVKNAQREWEVVENHPTIIPKEADDYYPVILRNSWSAYNISMKVSKEYFTTEELSVSLQIIDKAFNPCGESKEMLYYKVAEYGDTVEYHTRVLSGKDYVRFIFFGEREMPSYDDYHVLKICNGNSFYIKGEVINE